MSRHAGAVVAVLGAVALAGGAGSMAAAVPFQSLHEAAREQQRPPPGALWYRVRVTYSAIESVTSQVRPGPGSPIHVDQETRYRVAAAFRGRSAVLLRRRPGRSFAVVAGRRLDGAVRSWRQSLQASAPACSGFAETSSAARTGVAAASLGVSPRGRRRVEIEVGGVGNAASPSGLVAVRRVLAPWSCNLDELQARQLLVPSPYGNAGGRMLSAPGTKPAIVGDDQGANDTRMLSPRLLRPASVIAQPARFAIVVNGARFGARRFTRRTSVFRTLNPTIGPRPSGPITTVREKWGVTFTRCPRPRPC